MRRGGGYDDQGRPYRLDADGSCSPNQWGRVQRELDRLGVADRGERLRLVAQLAGLEGALASTRDLTAGEAGQAGRLLVGCRTVYDAWRVADPGRAARQRARQWAKLAAALQAAGAS